MGARVFAEGRGGAATTVSISQRRIFSFEIERFYQFARSQHVKRFSSESVDAQHGRVFINAATEAVKTIQQCLSMTKLIQCDSIQPHVGETIAIGLKRGVSETEETRQAGIGVGGVTGLCGQSDERRNRRINGSLNLRDR